MSDIVAAQAVFAILCTGMMMLGISVTLNSRMLGISFFTLGLAGFGAFLWMIGSLAGVLIMLFMAMSVSVILLYK